MTGKELCDYIESHNLKEKEIAVGCEGYTSIENEENEITLYVINNKLLIADNCGGYKGGNE